MNQLPYQQTQNNLIQNQTQNQNQTSLNQLQPIGFPQNNILQNNLNIVQYKNLLDELSQSTFATIISGSRTAIECWEDTFGFQNNRKFFVELTKNNGTRQAFSCIENTGTCQRFCVKHAFKNCVLDIFYNTSFSNSSLPNYNFLTPYIKATRTNGGFCPCCENGILNVFYIENQRPIGSIVQNGESLVDIKDISNSIKYTANYDVKVEKKMLLLLYWRNK